MRKKQATSIRLSPEAKRLLALLADKFGISQAAAMEIAIRRLAEQERLSEHEDLQVPVVPHTRAGTAA